MASHFMKVSGHKSENSVKYYSSVWPDSKNREMIDALAGNMSKINWNPSKMLPQ